MSKRTPTQLNRPSFKKMLTLGVGVAALAFTGAAVAQEAADEEDSARTLQTVVITSTKREQTLQSVPVAVSVVDDSVIEKAEIIDLGDLQSLVPSLSVGQLQSSANTNFIIRGFGNGANNAGIEPSVGVFIDGVYRSRSAAQIGDLPNLQRVEVLRGPQSTLFDKNAAAGVISVVTEKAQFEWGGGVEATYGNFNTTRLSADITGPLSETLAFSLAGNYNARDGYANDLNTNSEVNERNRYGVRGQFQFEPTEDLSFRLIGDYDKIDEVCCVAANLINGPTGFVIQNVLGGQLDAENPYSYNVYNNFDSSNDIDNSGISLQGDYDAGFATLTSITAFRKSELATNQDSDFTSADLLNRNSNETDIETFTQELRLTSNTDGIIDWMIGGFYFDESVDIVNNITYGTDIRPYVDALSGGAIAQVEALLVGPQAVGLAFVQPNQGLSENFTQDNQATSIFGTLDFHATDRFTISVGLNYTKDEKQASGTVVSTDSFAALDFVDIGILQGLAGFGVDGTDPAQLGAFIQNNGPTYAAIVANANSPANPLLGLQAVQFFPQFVNFPNAVENGETDDSDVTYSVRGAYDVTDSLNAYLSYSTGFKSSSWNLSRDSRPFPADYTPGSTLSVIGTPAANSPLRAAGLAQPNLTTGSRFAGPEEAAVWEVGVKGAFDTFAFNVALFDQVITGFQSNTFTGTGFALANAGKQSVRGLELDLQSQLTDNFSMTFAGTFLDPKYDSFPNATQGDLSGTEPSGIPDVSTSLGGLYEVDLSNGWAAYARADWQYESDTAFFDGGGNDPANLAISAGDYDREVDVINAAIGFNTENGLGVRVWGRNIFDDQRITTAFPSVAQAGSFSGYPSQPATYGITVSKEF